jgi:hypothetical protein
MFSILTNVWTNYFVFTLYWVSQDIGESLWAWKLVHIRACYVCNVNESWGWQFHSGNSTCEQVQCIVWFLFSLHFKDESLAKISRAVDLDILHRYWEHFVKITENLWLPSVVWHNESILKLLIPLESALQVLSNERSCLLVFGFLGKCCFDPYVTEFTTMDRHRVLGPVLAMFTQLYHAIPFSFHCCYFPCRRIH